MSILNINFVIRISNIINTVNPVRDLFSLLFSPAFLISNGVKKKAADSLKSQRPKDSLQIIYDYLVGKLSSQIRAE